MTTIPAEKFEEWIDEHRFAGLNGYPKDKPFSVTFHPDRLWAMKPSKGAEGKVIFVNSMSDMFHPDTIKIMGQRAYNFTERTPYLDQWDFLLHKINKMPKTTFVILTKRPENIPHKLTGVSYQLHNLYVGVSIESADEMWRLDSLNKTWEGKKVISFEPLLGDPFPLEDYGWINWIDWIIIGPENGPNKRSYPAIAAEKIKQYCLEHKIPVFMKTRTNEIDVQQFPKCSK